MRLQETGSSVEELLLSSLESISEATLHIQFPFYAGGDMNKFHDRFPAAVKPLSFKFIERP
jgi:hypothetical protein